MASALLPGAEPFAADGGPHGALVLHGFTGNPHSLKGIARRFADDGWAVECPLLPGHGTTVADMQPTRWSDWSATVEAAYTRLSDRVPGRVVVAGLSMGATLALWLADRHPEIAGLVCINPWASPPGPLRDMLQAAVDQGLDVMPGIGSDIADPGTRETSYTETPLRPLLSLFDAAEELQPVLPSIGCPILLFTSRHDHVIPTVNSDHLADTVGGPVERVWLERSYHVATLDYDKDEIEARALEFGAKVAADG
jgi:carboxylesterase